MQGPANPRDTLQAVYQAAIKAVNGRTAVSRALVSSPPPSGPIHLVAIGKAAMAMTHGAVDALGDQITAALAITRVGYDDPELLGRLPVVIHTAPHPVPDERSLIAGEALTQFLDSAPDDARFLFLISGGASSLVERLSDGADAHALATLNQQLLAGGLDIVQMNRIRKAVSTIKGGRLSGWLRGRKTQVLLISDVPGDDPAVIGSGLLAGDPDPMSPTEAARRVPPGLEVADAPPAPDSPALACIDLRVIASNTIALDAAEKAAQQAGWPVIRSSQFLQGESAPLGAELAKTLVNGPPGIILWGGEPTVTLPPEPGRGGRMQTLALAAAQVIRDAPCWMLAAGTDGADGPGEDAGALVDGQTLARGEQAGLSVSDCLLAADAGRFLQAAGDLLQTGATGTNVMDLVIGLKDEGA